MKVTGLSVALRKYIEQHAGVTIYLDDMVDDLQKWERKVIQNAVTTMVREEVMPGLDVVERGRIWRYRPHAGGKRVFEEKITTKSGDLIIEDSDGNLWRAKPLD